MAKKISKVREHKMQAQAGRCYYCGQPMWVENPKVFSQTLGVSLQMARLFQCTAEHLVPKSEGGPDHADNIVAACLFCNKTRHTFNEPPDPTIYKAHVQRRLASGRWLRLPGKHFGSSAQPHSAIPYSWRCPAVVS